MPMSPFQYGIQRQRGDQSGVGSLLPAHTFDGRGGLAPAKALDAQGEPLQFLEAREDHDFAMNLGVMQLQDLEIRAGTKHVDVS